MLKNKSSLIFFVLLILMLPFFFSGYRVGNDTARYIFFADLIISGNFSIVDLISTAQTPLPLIFYILPIFIISLLKIVFINNWFYIYIILNYLCIFIILYYSDKIINTISKNCILKSINAITYLVVFSFYLWPRYILTDTFCLLFSFLLFYYTYFGLKLNIKIYYIYSILLSLLLLLTRPTSVVLILATFFSLILGFSFHKISIRKVCVILISFLAIFFIASALFYSRYNGNIEGIKFLINSLQIGEIISEHSLKIIFSDSLFWQSLFIFPVRFLYFFIPISEEYSLVHNLVSLLNGFLVILTLYNLLKENKFNNFIYMSILLYIVLIAAFHAVTIIDYDWRYRYPIEPFLILLFSISLRLKKLHYTLN